MAAQSKPRVLADLPVSPFIAENLRDHVELVPWRTAPESGANSIVAIYTYGHPTVDAALLERVPRVRVISNFGVGVDHIDVAAANQRKIPVGNTPGILDGATADQGFALLLAIGRRLTEGDRYARGPEFLRYDPSYMLGREVHADGDRTLLGEGDRALRAPAAQLEHPLASHVAHQAVVGLGADVRTVRRHVGGQPGPGLVPGGVTVPRGRVVRGHRRILAERAC